MAALAALAALVAASCGSSPSTPQAGTTTTHHAGPAAAPSTSTTTATPASTLPPVSTSGPLQAGTAIALPFSADRVTAAESPDGAVFAAPQDPTSPSPAMAWVVDGNGPAAIAEHVPTGIAALAADSTNFYVATYYTVFAYDRGSGNQDGQWTMPTVQTANSSDNDLVALAAAGGDVLVSVTQGDTVSVYRIDPTSSAAPHLLLRGLGDAIGSDGSVYYESADHHLDVRRPDGATVTGPALAATPNGLGGGVQYLDVVAGGAVWVSEPAGQGLDATYTTYDVATLQRAGHLQRLGDEQRRGLRRRAARARGRRDQRGLPGRRPGPDVVRLPHRRARHLERPGGGRVGRQPPRPRTGRRRVRHLDRAVRPGAPVVLLDGEGVRQ